MPAWKLTKEFGNWFELLPLLIDVFYCKSNCGAWNNFLRFRKISFLAPSPRNILALHLRVEVTLLLIFIPSWLSTSCHFCRLEVLSDAVAAQNAANNESETASDRSDIATSSTRALHGSLLNYKVMKIFILFGWRLRGQQAFPPPCAATCSPFTETNRRLVDRFVFLFASNRSSAFIAGWSRLHFSLLRSAAPLLGCVLSFGDCRRTVRCRQFRHSLWTPTLPCVFYSTSSSLRYIGALVPSWRWPMREFETKKFVIIRKLTMIAAVCTDNDFSRKANFVMHSTNRLGTEFKRGRVWRCHSILWFYICWKENCVIYSLLIG